MDIKKNLLDLEYQRYLQLYTAVLILIFTYIIGIMVAFLTKQIDIKDVNQIWILVAITLFFMIFAFYFITKFSNNLTKIKEEIKNIET